MEPYLDPTRHPSDATLEFFSLGRLEEPELERVETHLLTCEVCQDSVTEFDAYLPALKSVLAETHPQLRATAPWWNAWIPYTPALGGAVAALALGIVLLRPGDVDLQPAPVTLRSERSGGANDLSAKGPANSPLDLRIQSNSLTVNGRDHLVVVDAGGTQVWSGGFDGSTAHVREGLSAGTYWVRLYDAQDQLLQEYGLHLN